MAALPPSSAAPLGPFDYALYAATVVIFGSSWLPLRLQLGVVSPEVSGVWRFLIAAVLMFGVGAMQGAPLKVPLKQHPLLAFIGATLFSLNFLGFYYAGYWLNSGLMSVLFALAAVFIPLFSAVYNRVAPSPRILIGAVMGIGGIALVFGPALQETGLGSGVGFGLLTGLCGTVAFALGSIATAGVGKLRIPQATVNAYGMLYGGLIFLVLALVMHRPFIVEWTPRYLGSMAFLILVPTLLGFAVYMRLIARIGASRAGYATVVFPVVTLMLSTLLENYHWSVSAAVGIALVLAGNVVVLRARRT